jgi:phosphoserine phosphatase
MPEHLSYALVVSGAPGALQGDLVRQVEAAVADRPVIQSRWLSAIEAWETLFVAAEHEDLGPLRQRVFEAANGRPVDVNIVADDIAYRRKKLLVADMDSTMIGQECIDELADLVGLKPHVAAITERAMRGEIAFEPALRERVALLKGLPASVVDDVIANRIALTPGGRTLIATMRAHGAHTCLISGGFTAFTQRIAAMIGFDEQRGNTLEIDSDGRLGGTVAEPILGREAKRATLVELRDRLGLFASDTMAVGDGANDLAMIQEAGLGVAYRAKPAVAAAAQARVDHGDLTALLFLQGYRRDEFAPA